MKQSVSHAQVCVGGNFYLGIRKQVEVTQIATGQKYLYYIIGIVLPLLEWCLTSGEWANECNGEKNIPNMCLNQNNFVMSLVGFSQWNYAILRWILAL